MKAPKLVRNDKVVLFVRISPETRDAIEQRAYKERKSFVDLIEETFGNPKEDKEDTAAFAELNF